MGGAAIRRATAADAPTVRDLVERSYALYASRMDRRPAPMDQDYKEVFRASDSWIAEIDGEIVGVVVTRPEPEHLFVENIAVDPAVQGRGIGGRLLTLAEDHAVACGLDDVRLYTNEVMTENLSFYSRHGYRETGRAQHEGFRRVFFVKKVATR